MYPDHHALTPACPSKPQCLTPYFPLVLTNFLYFFPLLFLSALNVLVVAREPLRLSTLVLEVCAVFLESCSREQREFIIVCHFRRRPWYDHGRYRLVALKEVLFEVRWDYY